MRGLENKQRELFSYINMEDRIPKDHSLRKMKSFIDGILEAMSCFFDTIYSALGAPSIPPEYILRALLLQILFTIRSERQLMEHIEYNILFRWFVGLGINEEIWDHSTFTKNKDRLLEHEVASRFFQEVKALAEEHDLLSDSHFSVDGTLLEANASMKSFVRKDQPENQPPPDDPGNPTVDFKGEKRSNETHASKTDPDARLYKKAEGQQAKLCYIGHAVIENRNGIAVSTRVTHATGKAEREACENMMKKIKPLSKEVTLAEDKGYDVAEHIQTLRNLNVTPHVAQKKNSSIDARTTRHAGYEVSMRKRKRIEEVFGWEKTIGGFRKLRHRGIEMVDHMFTLGTAAYNIVRIANLVPSST
jgi:transposase